MDKLVPDKDPKTGRFLTGNIGGGRPKGARAKLGEAFIEALAADFEQNGVRAIVDARLESPMQYIRVIAGLLPKDVNLNVNTADDLTDAELAERIRQLGSAIAPFLAGGTGSADENHASETSAFIASRVH